MLLINVQVLTCYKCAINVNKALALVYRSIGRGHAAPWKITSILNLWQPVSCTYWRRHTHRISGQTKKLLRQKLGFKCREISNKQRKDKGNVRWSSTKRNVDRYRMNSPSGSRYWASSARIVDVFYEGTGKVLDIMNF